MQDQERLERLRKEMEAEKKAKHAGVAALHVTDVTAPPNAAAATVASAVPKDMPAESEVGLCVM